MQLYAINLTGFKKTLFILWKLKMLKREFHKFKLILKKFDFLVENPSSGAR